MIIDSQAQLYVATMFVESGAHRSVVMILPIVGDILRIRLAVAETVRIRLEC